MTVRHIRQQELMRERCRLASIRNNRLIQKQVVVMDLKSLPMFVEWAAMKSLHSIIQIDEAFYPETLKTVFVINAPVYFTAIWAVVKPWLDPLVLQKVQILGANYYETMKNYIDEEMIPVESGGQNTNFSWIYPTNFTDF